MLNTTPFADDELDPLATATLIERLQAAGHQVHQDRVGGFLVTRWGMTRHCIDGESLHAFVNQLGKTA